MNRSTRIVIGVVVIAILGLAALAWLADSYRKALPGKSVADLPKATAPAVSSGARAPEQVEIPPPPPIPSATQGHPATDPPREPTPVEPARHEPDTEAALVDQFIRVRSTIKKVMEESPDAMDVLLAEIDGKQLTPKAGRDNATFGALVNIRVSRGNVLRQTGLSVADYKRVSEIYREWREGRKDAVDVGLGRAFESRAQDLAAVDLGPYEAVERSLGF